MIDAQMAFLLSNSPACRKEGYAGWHGGAGKTGGSHAARRTRARPVRGGSWGAHLERVRSSCLARRLSAIVLGGSAYSNAAPPMVLPHQSTSGAKLPSASELARSAATRAKSRVGASCAPSNGAESSATNCDQSNPGWVLSSLSAAQGGCPSGLPLEPGYLPADARSIFVVPKEPSPTMPVT